MNRREAIQLMTAGVAATGVQDVTAYAIEKPVDAKSTIVVLKLNRLLSMDTKARIVEQWQRVMQGTAFEDVRVVVLDEEFTLEIHQR